MSCSNELSCEAGSFSHCCLNPHRCFQSKALRVYFPASEPWVAQSILLPSFRMYVFKSKLDYVSKLLFLFLYLCYLVRLVMLLFFTVVTSRKGILGRHTFQYFRLPTLFLNKAPFGDTSSRSVSPFSITFLKVLTLLPTFSKSKSKRVWSCFCEG